MLLCIAGAETTHVNEADKIRCTAEEKNFERLQTRLKQLENLMYLELIRQTFRHARRMEVLGFVLTIVGIAGCVSAAALWAPGLVTGSLLCTAGIAVFLMA